MFKNPSNSYEYGFTLDTTQSYTRIRLETEIPTSWQTLKHISSLAIWPILGYIFHPAFTIINAVMCGYLGDLQLAALGLGSVSIGILGLAMCSTFSTAVLTRVSQSHGAGKKRMCRVYLYRQYFLNTCFYLPLVIPMIYVRQIYAGMKITDSELVDMAAQFVWYNIPGIYFHMQSVATISFGCGQGMVRIALYSFFPAAVMHLILSYLFIYTYAMGFTGVCLATSFHFFVRFLVAFILANTSPYLKNDPEDPAYFFCYETTDNLKMQFWHCIWQMLLGMWSWMCFDIFTVITSYLDVTAESAQTILRSVGLMTFMIPVGMAVASSNIIGHNVGRQNVKMVKHLFKWSMILSFILAITLILLLNLIQDVMIQGFTSSKAVQNEIYYAWRAFYLFVFFNTTMGVGAAIMRATGAQKIGALISSVSYLFIGMPIAVVLALRPKNSWGLQAIWFGPMIAVIFDSVCYLLVYYQLNLKTIIKTSYQIRKIESISAHSPTLNIHKKMSGQTQEPLISDDVKSSNNKSGETGLVINS